MKVCLSNPRAQQIFAKTSPVHISIYLSTLYTYRKKEKASFCAMHSITVIPTITQLFTSLPRALTKVDEEEGSGWDFTVTGRGNDLPSVYVRYLTSVQKTITKIFLSASGSPTQLRYVMHSFQWQKRCQMCPWVFAWRYVPEELTWKQPVERTVCRAGVALPDIVNGSRYILAAGKSAGGLYI